MVEVEQLLKVYGPQIAVNKISFSVNKGEIAAFVGPNGAGKSTTMKMITGYLQPDGGKIKICGINVQEHPMETKKRIGYLPESNPLYYDMYVREYLFFIAGIYRVNNLKKRIEDIIDLTSLNVESKKKIGQLSKGFKQRVGLAAALVHDPEILILDEPTSGLDPNQIIEIRNVIKQQGQNKAVLFSSHILQEVQAICDRVIIIHMGRLVADDTIYNLQQTNKHSVCVAFKEELEKDWFLRLSSVINAHKADSFTWQLETENITETKKELLELALQNNLNIISLQKGGENLEEIFRSLTNVENR